MSDPFPVQDNVIYQEMMTHPALYAHPHPKKIVIIGDNEAGMTKEALHHEQVKEVHFLSETTPSALPQDNRISIYNGKTAAWLNQIPEDTFDILINAGDANLELFKDFFKILHADGIFIQQSDSPYHLHTLKKLQETIAKAHFSDLHFIIFPQPNFPSGLRCAIMAKKSGNFRRVREKDIFNKNFSTRYYNLDVHKASLVLPEFMRKELEAT